MELKQYQKRVMADLQDYLDLLLRPDSGSLKNVFAEYWQSKGMAADKIALYCDKLGSVPNVCLKVPTAGGKTFLAVNALKPVFDARSHYGRQQPQMVVWLVPSEAILSQTLKNLHDVQHPYRRRLNTDFGGRVQVFDKEDVLRGNGFDADTVQSGVSVLVMTFDSLKGRSKDTLRAFRENGNLASFAGVRPSERQSETRLPKYDETALINVLRGLNPMIVVDESHNAATPLSLDMIGSLNPCFVLELTATPRESSNIISYVGASALKNEQMVKLPVIVSRQRTQNEVLMAAVTLRANLERAATEAQKQGGAYIRPIVLFQAEPRSKDDKATFEKVKTALTDIGIPPEQIAVKTAEINELKNQNLLSPECPIRFVITVNALKEGWDCPFAYILASLANRSSETDVTQIVGRILRQPYVRNHALADLNISYVFTSSEQFDHTLSKVAEGLNKAGFSERDYRVAETVEQDTAPSEHNRQPENATAQPEFDLTGEAAQDDDGFRLNIPADFRLPETSADTDNGVQEAAERQPENQNPVAEHIARLQQQAAAAGQAFAERAAQNEAQQQPPEEIKDKMNTQAMRPEFAKELADFRLPQFVFTQYSQGLFGGGEALLLDKANLLQGFALGKCDSNIPFGSMDSSVWLGDTDQNDRISFQPMKGSDKQHFMNMFAKQSAPTQQAQLVQKLFELAGRKAFYPIEDGEIRKYLSRIVEDMDAERREHCFNHAHTPQYFTEIKRKIDSLAAAHAETEFDKGLQTRDIVIRPHYPLPPSINPNRLYPLDISNSLYKREGEMNSFEAEMLRRILADEEVSLKWWHRNDGRKGFCINGFINHYPDFVLMTARGTLVLLETKGGQLDGSDSAAKIRLGKAWENACRSLGDGRNYVYMMVFEQQKIDGAYGLAEALAMLARV